jgi:hypothetical protein
MADMGRSFLIGKAALQGKDALRTLLDEDDDGDEDGDFGNHRAGPAFEQLGEDAQTERRPDRAGELPDAADDDHHEGIDDVALAHVRADVGNLRQRHAAESGDAGTEGEGHGVDARGRHADAAGHRPVLGDGADEHAEPGLVHQHPDQEQHEQREADDDHAVPRQDQVGQQFDAARHPARVGNFDVLRAEDHARRLDQHQ